jgi:broad specificity phosphatase PhoE
MKVTIHFIRHGESSANVLQKSLGCFHICLRDPSLTTKGDKESSVMNIPHADIVCCSELLRAKQTAALAFPDNLIYVLPGTSELGLGFDNVPQRFDKQYTSYKDISRFIHLQNDDTCDNFFVYLQKHLLKNKKDNFIIALFTHQRFIAKYTDVKRAKNNQVVTKEFIL